jgi:O-antigen/teichoic acid export membrane protein
MRVFGGGEAKSMTELRRLVTTFGFLVAKQGAVAAIGLGYWVITTHLFPAQEVGVAAAAASTALLLVAIGALGIPLLLLAELGQTETSERRVMFTTGTAISAFVVLVLAIGTMALSPFLGKSLHIIGDDPFMATLFVVGSVATMASTTLDQTAVGLHRGAAQLWRGSLSSLVQVAVVGVLILFSTRTSTGLIFAWAVALIVAFVVCVPMLGLGPVPAGGGTLTQRRALVDRYGTLSLQHHVLNLSISSVSMIIPLIVTLLVSPAEVAYFSAAFLLQATLMIIPYLLTLALFAERSGDPGLLHRHVRRTLPFGLALVGAIVLVVEVAAPYALRIFGPGYAAGGTTALRIVILVGPAYVIKDHYVAICRAQHRMPHASRVIGTATVVEVSATVLGGILWGLTGICAGWAVSATVVAMFLLPAVLHVYRHAPPDDSPVASELDSDVGAEAD